MFVFSYMYVRIITVLEIVSILTFMQFSGEGHYSLYYESPRMLALMFY